MKKGRKRGKRCAEKRREEKRGKINFCCKKWNFFLQCIYAQRTDKFEGLKVYVS